jgi:hypothetical protein
MSDNLIQSNATTNKTSLKMSKWKVIKRAIAVDSAFKQKISKFKIIKQLYYITTLITVFSILVIIKKPKFY